MTFPAPSPILITGCSSGIGRAAALRLARSGHKVWATARRLESIEDLVEAGCRTLALDVTAAASRAAAVETIEAEDGPLGALVNNAGYSQSGAVETVPLDAVRRQFETNVFGLIGLCQLVLPGMRRAGRGRIVNIGSMGGRLTFPGGGVYHATKYSLEALSDALRFETAGFGVQVALIQPGLIRTGYSEAAVRQAPPVVDGPYRKFHEDVLRITRDVYVRGFWSKLAGDPDDVAKVIERALTTPKPKSRYRVTASATVFMTLRALLPDSVWDAVMAKSYSRPR